MLLGSRGRAVVFLAFTLALAGCGSPQQRAAAYLKRGNQLFAEGQYEKARLEYKNALRLEPASANLAYRLGLVEEAERHYRPAFVDFTHAEEQNAHFAPALLKLAEYYLVAGRLDETQKRIDTVLAKKPNDADAHALHAGVLLRRKDFTGCEKEARFALAQDPGDAVAYAVLAGLYTQQGDDAKAIATVEQGIAHDPKEMSLLLLRAGLYEKTGDLAKIATAYQAIFARAPGAVAYRTRLADLYLKAGKLIEAEATLRAGIAAQPDNRDMQRALIAFLAGHRGLDAAEKQIRQWMQADPHDAILDAWLVDLYVGHDQADRAVAFLQPIVAQNRFDKEGLYARTALARIDYGEGNKEEAGHLAATVLVQDPNDLDALLVKARLEFDLGQYQDAVADLRAILLMQPHAAEPLHLMAETLLRQGHPDLAIDTLDRLIAQDPLDKAARVRLAQIYRFDGDPQHAMDLLFLVTKQYPHYAVAWESVARAAIGMKDWTTATNAIDTLDGLPGRQKLAAFLRGRLLQQTGKPADAIVSYKQAVGGDPSAPLSIRALRALVETAKSLGQLPAAADYIRSLKTNDPTVATVLSECYMDMGKDSDAAATLDQAIAAHARNAETYLDRARLFVAAQQPARAIGVLKAGAAEAPADMRLPVMEAEVDSARGDYKQAIALYGDLLARNPQLDAVANNMAALIADHDYDDAAALAKAHRASERFVASTDPLYLDTLGWVDYRLGKIDEARIFLARATADGTASPEIYYHYGAILLKAGARKQAKVELEKALAGGGAAFYPGLDDARKMRAGL
ncbi:MAG TPA: tetratricopeptide repeat protein [Alphaproteobacteria bacterium]|nr:tetratricopeptide repeat protein [Alphaproteobacteria bacterium]